MINMFVRKAFISLSWQSVNEDSGLSCDDDIYAAAECVCYNDLQFSNERQFAE